MRNSSFAYLDVVIAKETNPQSKQIWVEDGICNYRLPTIFRQKELAHIQLLTIIDVPRTNQHCPGNIQQYIKGNCWSVGSFLM